METPMNRILPAHDSRIGCTAAPALALVNPEGRDLQPRLGISGPPVA
jgi:hypothetical protein